MDNDWRVREALHNTFAVLVHTLSLRRRYWLLRSMHFTCKYNCTQPLQQIGIVGKKLATQLKSLIGPWLCCQFDPATEVRTIAKSTFAVCRNPAIQPAISLSRSLVRSRDTYHAFDQSAIPPKKHQEAILFCSESLFKYLASNLRQTPQSLCMSQQLVQHSREGLARECLLIHLSNRIRVASEGSSASENQEKYDRLVSSTLQAFAFVLGMRYGARARRLLLHESWC